METKIKSIHEVDSMTSEEQKNLEFHAEQFLRTMDTQEEALTAVGFLLEKVGEVFRQVVTESKLTAEGISNYSFASCLTSAIIQSLLKNPVFGEGVFKDQAMHHFRNTLQIAYKAEIKLEDPESGESG